MSTTPPGSGSGATGSPPTWSLEWWGRWARPALGIVLLLTPILLWIGGGLIGSRGSVCAPQARHHKLQTEVVQPAVLNLPKGQRTTIVFGRDLDTKRLTVPLEVVDGELVERTNPLMRVIAEFHRDGEDDGAQLSPRIIHVTAKGRGKVVRVRVCVEREEFGDTSEGGSATGGGDAPSPDATGGTATGEADKPSRDAADGEAPEDVDPPEVDPGTYEGSVTFVDNRVESFTLPLTIKLAYPRWPRVAILLYAVVLIGSFYVWILRREDADEVVLSAKAFRTFFRWCSKWNGLLAVSGGTAAAVTVFVATYLASPDWGVGIPQSMSLFGAMFTAFVTAASALAKKSALDGTKGGSSSGSEGTR